MRAIIVLMLSTILMSGCALKPSFNSELMPGAIPNEAPIKINLPQIFNDNTTQNMINKFFRSKYKPSVGHDISTPFSHNIKMTWVAKDRILIHMDSSAEDYSDVYLLTPSTKDVKRLLTKERVVAIEELRARFSIKSTDPPTSLVKSIGKELMRTTLFFNFPDKHSYVGTISDENNSYTFNIKERYKRIFFTQTTQINTWKEFDMKVSNEATGESFEDLFTIEDGDAEFAVRQQNMDTLKAWLGKWRVDPSGMYFIQETFNDEPNKIVLMKPSIQKEKGLFKKRMLVDRKKAYSPVVEDYFYIDSDISPAWDSIAFINGRTRKDDKFWEYYVEIYPFDAKAMTKMKAQKFKLDY